MNLIFKLKKGTDPKYGKYIINTEMKDGEIIQNIEFSEIPGKKFFLYRANMVNGIGNDSLYFRIPYPYPKESGTKSFNHDFSKMIQAIKDGYADTIVMSSNSIYGMHEYPVYFINRHDGIKMRDQAELEFVNNKLCYAIIVRRGFGSFYLCDDNGERVEFETLNDAEKYIYDDIMSFCRFNKENENDQEAMQNEYKKFREYYNIVHSICTR